MMKNDSFDEYEFHDSMIHDMKFIIEEWERNFILDIDYILDGPINDEEPFNFQLTRGIIIFHNVIDIVVDINSKKEEHNYNISNPVILKIEKSVLKVVKNNINYYEWSIYTIDDKKTFSIVASDMVFSASLDSIIVARQHLYTTERNHLS